MIDMLENLEILLRKKVGTLENTLNLGSLSRFWKP